MFAASASESAAIPDALSELLARGRKLMRTKDSYDERIQEQQEQSAARSLLAAQRAMARFQWRPRASIALVDTCVCTACGSRVDRFSGFGVSMFRNSDQTERIVATPILDPAWPRETHYTHSVTHACMSCIELQGFQIKEDRNA